MKDIIIQKVQQTLKNAADEERKISGQRFFKEEVNLRGVKAADAHRISKELFNDVEGLSKVEIFDICEQLWQSGYLEESFVACDWSYMIRKQYEAADIDIFERWIEKYVNNWASCDTLCNHTVGDFVERYPGFISRLKEWARSNNIWMRRAAAVSLIIPARKGKFKDDILEIADILLMDNEDLVQKGYGWMLKAASQADQDFIFNYVMSKRATMPRTALRYAIEKMPADKRKQAMTRV